MYNSWAGTLILWLLVLLHFTDSFGVSSPKFAGKSPSVLHSSPGYSDDNARSSFGTREYWDDVYMGMADFPMDEYSWYYGFDVIKPYFVSEIPSKSASILVPGIGNDPILLDLWKAGYRQLKAFDYSQHAVERQKELLSWEPSALDSIPLLQCDARQLDPEWTDTFDAILEKGTLDAIYLSGDGNVEQAVQELRRVLKPGGIIISVSGVVPEKLRRTLFASSDWEWIRDGSEDLKAGCFVWKLLA